MQTDLHVSSAALPIGQLTVADSRGAVASRSGVCRPFMMQPRGRQSRVKSVKGCLDLDGFAYAQGSAS